MMRAGGGAWDGVDGDKDGLMKVLEEEYGDGEGGLKGVVHWATFVRAEK